MKSLLVSFLLIFNLLLVSCDRNPESIIVGKDVCAFCKMTISDARFGAEVITKKGKIYKYDEIHCFINSIDKAQIDSATVDKLYFINFCLNHTLVPLEKSFFLASENLRSPMGGNIAVFLNQDSLLKTQQKIGGEKLTWEEIYP
ncbi:MAG: hypothetical protein KA450_08230 [Bacteroidia bacterium]|nr:hypothetical protein [Bacteroidota bacterium]MBP6413411.1 hypothetical protein [Bacteroidia bacterium]